MTPLLALYRVATGAVGSIAAPLGGAIAPRGSAWRERWGRIAGAERVAGGPWIHAASMGEAAAARRWVEALRASGYRAPMLVTTRTRAGRERVARELPDAAVPALAPLDAPQAVRALLADATPMRLDLIETELWPNLLLEAHRAGLPAVAVSATVSERTARRYRALGLAGSDLFGPLHVLAQSELHASRYRSLGVAPERCRVIGDLKADVDAAADAPDAARGWVVFASYRPGEEEAMTAVARALAAHARAGEWRYVVAPRHDAGVRSAERALEAAGFSTDVRSEAAGGAAGAAGAGVGGAVDAWAARLGSVSERRVGILATRGELPSLFAGARVAIVGGTFARFGGHNVWEAAARGARVIVGPHHDEVEPAVTHLAARGVAFAAPDVPAAVTQLVVWIDEGEAPAHASAARDAVRDAAGAAARGLDALDDWGLGP